ncbi:NAD(P)-binding protein [Exidia glandulosa HHB12029]|uniref:NAD(P)-binding protein n=1 Tax=Exidia glandulosa HHB12029 TaxID=1314781 RepID=A0A165K4G9_EXIGL|nr:NAD(P)-binding protein [Exidia glandulosa HHB12029]
MCALNIAAYVFGVIGLLTVAAKFYRFLVFTYAYFPGLHDREIEKYRWSSKPYALVTAATDGIGKALATELYRRGFNLIIHGRNAEKLAAVRDTIRASGNQEGDVRIWRQDAGKGRWDPTQLLELTEGLDLTVVALVNGGSDVKTTPIDGQTDDEVHHVMSFNFFFSVFVIRTLLPSLRATTSRGPVTLFGLGSLVTVAAPPYLAIYGASKSALEFVLRGIAADERFAKRGHNLNIKYLQVGNVNSAGNTTPPDFQTPTSEAFAKDLIRRIDAPWRWAAANPVHAVMAYFVGLLPEQSVEKMASQTMEKQWGPGLKGKRSD